MAFLQEIEVLATRLAGDTARFGGEAATLLQQRVARHPERLFSVLREVKPIFVKNNFAAVTRYEDVIEVLSRDREFSVGAYTPTMDRLAGGFILGEDDGPKYRHDSAELRKVMTGEDLPWIADLAIEAAEEALAHGSASGRLDLVTGFARRVPAKVAARYFGAPGPDEATLTRWSLDLFEDIFINLARYPEITARAETSAEEMRQYLDGLIRRRKTEPAAGSIGDGTVLTRLIRAQGTSETAFNDVQIRNNVIGMIVGWIPTVSTAISRLIDELLSRPGELLAAQEAARSDDDRLVQLYVFEALRFQPQSPGVVRLCVEDCTIARGTRRETTIPAGTVTFVATQSAMMDPRVVDHPREFRIDRPADHYLHFGHGLHTCFGRHINRVQIPAASKVLLQHTKMRRSAGGAGRLTYRNLYPQSMSIELDTAA